MITPTHTFAENLGLLPSIDGITRIEMLDAAGAVVATIQNQAGKKGSLAVYQYLGDTFGVINPEAATHGLAVFAEHTADAKANPGAHPNIDLLLNVIENGAALTVKLTQA